MSIFAILINNLLNNFISFNIAVLIGVKGMLIIAPTFWYRKKKTGYRGQKERVSKQKILKSRQGESVPVSAMLERPKFKIFFVGHPW